MRREVKTSSPKAIKSYKKIESGRKMYDKIKRNIKYLDISLNIAHDSSTSHLSISYFASAATAKYATVANS